MGPVTVKENTFVGNKRCMKIDQHITENRNNKENKLQEEVFTKGLACCEELFNQHKLSQTAIKEYTMWSGELIDALESDQAELVKSKKLMENASGICSEFEEFIAYRKYDQQKCFEAFRQLLGQTFFSGCWQK